MIINTGARTDIPAFFGKWLLNRLKAGFVCVRSPYADHRITRYRLDPVVVDALLFCTKNPYPLLSHFAETDRFASYWFVTITPYGREIEPSVPRAEKVMEDFRTLARHYGPARVAWRYDPIFLAGHYTAEWHKRAFSFMAGKMAGYTDTCIISFIDLYAKTRRNFPVARRITDEEQRDIAGAFVETGAKYGIRIKACAEALNLRDAGVDQSGCMGKATLERALGSAVKDLHSAPARENCRCYPSRDIGAYNTCLHGCRYCYANTDMAAVRRNFRQHDPASPLLFGHIGPKDEIRDAVQDSVLLSQGNLF